MNVTRRSLSALCAVMGMLAASAADGEAGGISLKVSAVMVSPEDAKDIDSEKLLPPQTRITVPDEKHMAVFMVDYEIPADTKARIWLHPNCDGSSAGGCFGSSPSGMHSGTGQVVRILHLSQSEHKKSVLLKSVRLTVTKEGPSGDKDFYIGDVPVDVVYTGDTSAEESDFEVLEPLPPPPDVSTTILPGWTEDFEEAKARAAKEGKLILAYFAYSGKGEKGTRNHRVLGSKEFVKKAGKHFVLYMGELASRAQSLAAKNANISIAFEYAARRNSFRAPEMAIIHPDGKRIALLDKKGWKGGVKVYLEKIEKARKNGMKEYEAEHKARAEARKKIPPKTDGTSTPAGFTDNLDEAFARAKTEGKLVYACFSGSDWCGWCMELEKEVLSDPLFVAGVMEDYVLVFIDSPKDKNLLSEHAKAVNKGLVKKYGIEGFPTALIFDGDGKQIGETGYRSGGAAGYVEHLMSIRKAQTSGKTAK